MLVMLLFVPFGAYYSRVEPYIIGYLWGYHLPVGYAGLIAGIMVVLYSKLALVRKLRFGSIMIVVELFLFLSFFFWPKVYSINLLQNTRFDGTQVDIDSSIGNSVVWGLSLISIIVGLLLSMKRFQLSN